MQNIPLLLKKQILALGLVASLLQADSSFIAYQGVAYDNGVPKGSASIDLNLTIKQSGGAIVYSETQSGVSTTDKGFFAVQIGSGSATTGTYSAITWADNFKLNVQVDLEQDGTFNVWGTVIGFTDKRIIANCEGRGIGHYKPQNITKREVA